jgi:L-2-hydroxyglutarate oxidase LhgO
LKAELCRQGAQAMYQWCEERGVAHARIGKYIVATCAEEEPALARIHAQAHANGATEVVAVTRDVLAREEPNVKATAALWSPNTGIVDSHGFMAS